MVIPPFGAGYLRVTHPFATLHGTKFTEANMHRFPFDLHVLSTPPAFILSQDQTLRIFAAVTSTSLLLPERKRSTTLLRKATSNSSLTRSQARTYPHYLRLRPNPEAAFSSLLDFVYLATLQLLMCHNPVTLQHPAPPDKSRSGQFIAI